MGERSCTVWSKPVAEPPYAWRKKKTSFTQVKHLDLLLMSQPLLRSHQYHWLYSDQPLNIRHNFGTYESNVPVHQFSLSTPQEYLNIRELYVNCNQDEHLCHNPRTKT